MKKVLTGTGTIRNIRSNYFCVSFSAQGGLRDEIASMIFFDLYARSLSCVCVYGGMQIRVRQGPSRIDEVLPPKHLHFERLTNIRRFLVE